MCSIRNFDRGGVQSLIRDGFLPANIITMQASRNRLSLEQTDEIFSNRLWMAHGSLFLAVAILLRNDGDRSQIVEQCNCKISWQSYVELADKDEGSNSRIYIAGGEEFAATSVLNGRILGARLTRTGGSLDGTLIFRAYHLPPRQQLASTMLLSVNVLFTNGLEVSAPVKVRIQDIAQLRRMLPGSRVAPTAAIGAQPARPRRPLFDVDPDIGSSAREVASSDRECAA